MSRSYLVFDIETIPDTSLGAKYYNLKDLSEEDIAKLMFFKQRQEKQTEFLPFVFHKIVAISVLIANGEEIKVVSLGKDIYDEKGMIQQFFDGISHHKPTLVSWNGKGFDMPVIYLRAMHHKIQASYYWQGDQSRDFQFNNYVNRYHERHIDVMDVLAGFQNQGRASLDHVSVLLGFPGKIGIDGSQVWKKYSEGAYQEIRDYCDTDVISTYLAMIYFQHFRGLIKTDELKKYELSLEQYLSNSKKTHMESYLDHWKK